MRLTSHNVTEFWRDVWATNNTGWKLAECCAPFTRILYAYLQGAGVIVPVSKAGIDTDVGGDVNAGKEYKAVCQFLKGKTVFVPLCGDSKVLSYILRCGAKHVIGTDLCEHALSAQQKENFSGLIFNSQKLNHVDGPTNDVVMYKATDGDGCITLFQGNMMELPLYMAYTALEVDLMYDRAAMMAIPPDLRGTYVQAVTRVLRPSAGVVYERVIRVLPEERHLGPPFMVDMEEVRQLYRQATGRSYRTVLLLADDVSGPRRPEWYAVLPEV